MAADDPACRGCPHAGEGPVESLAFDRGNVRGRYHNVLGREQMRRWAASIASTLVDQFRTEGRRPQVIVGHDERPSSPDLAIALEALATGGCDLIDIGRSVRPMLDFAVCRAGADAGLFITGGRKAAGWTGLDLVGRGARSWSWPGLAEQACSNPSGRQSRSAGQTRTHQVHRHYLADLKTNSHGLRPLTVVVLVPTPLAVDVSTELATVWPGRVLVERATLGSNESIEDRLRSLRYDGFPASDIAFAMHTDCRSITVADESGRCLLPLGVARGVAELMPDTSVVERNDEATEETTDTQTDANDWVVQGDLIAGPDLGRLRRRDGFWLISQLLQRLAVSDAPASQVFAI